MSNSILKYHSKNTAVPLTLAKTKTKLASEGFLQEMDITK